MFPGPPFGLGSLERGLRPMAACVRLYEMKNSFSLEYIDHSVRRWRRVYGL